MAYPDEDALTQRATLKGWFDPPITDTDNDTALDTLILRVSNVLCETPELEGLSLVAGADFTEARDGQGDGVILRNWPVTSVTSVSVDGTTIPAATTATASGWLLDSESNGVRLRGYTFTRGIQNVVIVYKAGLTSGHRILGALEHAALVTAATWWKRRSHVDLASTSANGIQTQSFSQRDIPLEARTILGGIARHQPWIF